MQITKRKKVIIVGGHDQACRVLKYLTDFDLCDVVLSIARKDDSGEDDIFPSLIKLSKSLDIPIIQPNNFNSDSVLKVVNMFNSDLVLSIQNNMLFGEEWINLFDKKGGIINVHYSPLPRYSGFWPEMWAILNEEKIFGVTIHFIEKNIDTGPIIDQKFFDINELETRSSLYKKSSEICFELIKHNIKNILDNNISCKIQNLDDRTYFKRELPNQGFIELDWNASKINKYIRAIAFKGFPGPKIKIGDKVYTILEEDLPFFKSYNINNK